MMWFQLYVLMTLISGLSAMTSAWALSDSEVADSIQSVLKMRHPSESCEWWRALGSATPGIIIAQYKEDQNIYHKIRLIDSLSCFDDPASNEFMKGEALNSLNQTIKNSAIQSLIKSQGLKEQEFIAHSLVSENPHTRMAAANALNQLGDPRADTLVAGFLKKEKIAWVASKTEAHRAAQKKLRFKKVGNVRKEKMNSTH
jgi:hypothetical protein